MKPAKLKDATCDKCAYNETHPQAGRGRCKRFPPQKPPLVVDDNDWCGEWLLSK